MRFVVCRMVSNVRFGPFTFDPASGRLRRDGVDLALQPQPARVLAMLVTRPGTLVTRDELRRTIWSDTWVNFDQGLNYCIRQIRLALADDAHAPTYVQTLPQRGYRFIAPVERSSMALHRERRGGRRAYLAAAAGLALVAGLGLGLEIARHVATEIDSSPSAISAHLTPGHVLRGAWTHHFAPFLARTAVSGAARQSDRR